MKDKAGTDGYRSIVGFPKRGVRGPIPDQARTLKLLVPADCLRGDQYVRLA